MANSIPNWLQKRASLTPNRIALRYEDKQYTFAQLYDKSLKVARQLANFDLCPNKRIAILISNNVDAVVLLYALQIGQYQAVILNNRLTVKELAYQIADCRCQLVISENAFSQKAIEATKDNKSIKLLTVNQLFNEKELPVDFRDEFPLHNICSIMYTSGTTGNPKGVLQTYNNHWWSALGSVLNLGLSVDDCWLLAVPLFHISGYSILIRSVIYGIAIDLHSQFDEKSINNAIINNNITIMSAVPAMLTRLIKELKLTDQRYPSSFRCMLLGGGPVPEQLLKKCVKLGVPVFQTYGMTETASQIVTLAPEDSLQKIGSAGKPLFPIQLKILLANGEETKHNIAGEIVVKGPNITKSYLNYEDESFTNDGWFHTGDIGYLDKEGYLYVLDRRTDLIISGGENVYPAEIEATLLEHEAVVDAGVVGVNDEKWGSVPIGFVVLKKSARIGEQQLVKFCEENLAKYKVPRRIYVLEQLPRNAANKLLRKQLRQLIN